MPLLLAVNAAYALASAGFWGVGDFLGGMGVKLSGGSIRAALRFICFSHLASFAVLLPFALSSGMYPRGSALLWGFGAGVAGGSALLAFYMALARGTMGSAAAISGLLAAAIPSLVSALVEGAPGWQHLCGFAIAGGAIWLIGGGGTSSTGRFASLLAFASGAGFGLYFIALRYATPAGLVWPMVCARMGSLCTCGLMLLALKTSEPVATVSWRVLRWAFATALFDTSGNLLFIAATRAGRLDIAAVLASLYPASTILLAAAVLRERPTRRQIAGMAVALGAVVLVTL